MKVCSLTGPQWRLLGGLAALLQRRGLVAALSSLSWQDACGDDLITLETSGLVIATRGGYNVELVHYTGPGRWDREVMVAATRAGWRRYRRDPHQQTIVAIAKAKRNRTVGRIVGDADVDQQILRDMEQDGLICAYSRTGERISMDGFPRRLPADLALGLTTRGRGRVPFDLGDIVGSVHY